MTKHKKKIFKIPVTWQAWGVIKVEAETLMEAKEKALKSSLPLMSEYIDDSMEIDEACEILASQS